MAAFRAAIFILQLLYSTLPKLSICTFADFHINLRLLFSMISYRH